jgi:hypothetical protein
MRAKKTALACIFFQPQLREKFDGKAVINFRNLANLAISKQVNIFALARPGGGDKEVYKIDCIRVAARIPC